MSRVASQVAVGGMRPGDHACLTHGSDEERAEVLSVFIGEGLAGRQKVLLLSAEGRGPHEAAAFLAGYGIDPAPHLLSGRLAVGGSGAYTHEALPELVDEALRRGAPAVRVCRDAPRAAPAALLPVAERRLEALLDGRPVLLLCAYDERAFAPPVLAAALEAHRARAVPEPLYEDGLLRITRLFAPSALRLQGDVDASNINGLARVLAAEQRRLRERDRAAQPPEPLRLELSALDFMDVGGMRLLVRTAMTLHQSGGRPLVVAGLAPHLRRVMRVVGWDTTPGLELVTRLPHPEPGRAAERPGTETGSEGTPAPRRAVGPEPGPSALSA